MRPVNYQVAQVYSGPPMKKLSDSLSIDSTSFFESLLESAPDAMVIIDRTGSIRIVNRQAEKMFGFLRDELFGQKIELLMPEEYADAHPHHRMAYCADPHVRPMGKNLSLFGKRKNGSRFPVEISLSPLTTTSGLFISSVIRDVTDTKENERALQDARRKADMAHSANTAFLAAASHDLRQPVQALSLVNGALRRSTSDTSLLEMIDSQQQSLNTMTNLLNSLLDISRLSSGNIKPAISVFPLQGLISQITAEFDRQAKSKGLKLVVPQAEHYVRTDPDLVAEIIQNLVSNAIRYTDTGTVSVECEQHSDKIEIRIVDTGIGMTPDQIDRIFEEYYQVESSKDRSEGFGLGLAIVRRLADLLDLSIGVVSEPGVGSTFSFNVPTASRGEIGATSPSSSPHSDEDFSGGIVLIEDNASVGKALMALLTAAGFKVSLADSVERAINAVRALPSAPELIISDFHLKGDGSGLDAIAVIREHLDDLIPAIVVTGDTTPIVSKVDAIPNTSLLRKPVDPEVLIREAKQAIVAGEVGSPGDR